MSKDFDFKETAKSLLKKIEQSKGVPMSQPLNLAAIEAALREAYSFGTKKNSTGFESHSQRKKFSAPSSQNPLDCSHEWQEAFIEGRGVEQKCSECGILKSKVQEQCEHFYVQQGNHEVCMACRKRKA